MLRLQWLDVYKRQGVYQAILDNVWRLCHYPDPDCSELTETLAAHLGVAQENIVFGNGGAELIYACLLYTSRCV